MATATAPITTIPAAARRVWLTALADCDRAATPVLVAATKYAHGWPEHDTSTVRTRYMTLADALETAHATDAHFAAYSVPIVPRRLATDDVYPELVKLGVDVAMRVLIVDVDGEDHAASPEWRIGEMAKVDRLLEAHPGAFVYQTRGGYRIVYVLAEPFAIRSRHDAERWRRTYRAWLADLRAHFAIEGDPACDDWTRLYRLPDVVRDGERQDFGTVGDARSIGAWDVAVTIAEPEPARPRAPSGVVSRPGASCEELVRGWYPGVQGRSDSGGTAYDIPCPWEHEHSTRGRRGTSVWIAPGGGASFRCLHAHCKGRDWNDLRRFHEPDWTPYDERDHTRRTTRTPDEHDLPDDEDPTMSDDERNSADLGDEPAAETPRASKKSACDAPGPDFFEDAPPPSDDDAPSGSRRRAKPEGAVKVAQKYISKFATSAAGPLLRRWRGNWYHWTATRGCYAEQTDEQMRAELYQKLGLGKRADVGEVLDAMIAVEDVLIDHVELGEWLGDGKPPHPAHELAACRNGLLHLPSETLTPPSPRYFATSSLGVEYTPTAALPSEWTAFLRQLWPTDDESILLLQEWFGYLLTADTRQQKMLLIVGPKRSGKGTIGRAMTGLLGRANVVNPTLASLGTTFGLASWIGKSAAIIGDARLSGRTDIAQVIERLLSISGEDGQTIGRKFLPDWNGTLSARVMILTNEAPSFRDASDALPGRLLALELARSWYGQEDHELDTKLQAELGGILRWAIAGWRSLRRRGRFVQPQASAGMIDEIEDLGSPVKAWARDRYRTDERDPQWWTVCSDAYADFKTWGEAQGHKSVPTQTMFGRDVKTALGCDRKQITRERVGRPWVYVGLAKGLK